MKISVLIVSYRRPELLSNCLQSLTRQTRLPDEVVVVGAVEDQATAAVVDRFSTDCPFACMWHAAPAPSVVAQTNLGLARLSGDVVAFTNDDAEPFPDWLARLELYYEDEMVAAVGGRDLVHLADGRICGGQAKRVGTITWFGRLHGNHHLACLEAVDVDVLKGVNMSCRRELLLPLDSRMVGGGRWHWELDACLQVRSSGKRIVFDPQVRVDHFPGPRPDELDPDFVYMANYNLTLNLTKHFGPWRRVAFLLYTFLWGDYPEMGLVVFAKNCLHRLLRGDRRFIRLLGVSLRGKAHALRSLMGKV